MKGRVLGLELWIEEHGGVPRICYSFFKKPVASVFTIMKKSTVSEGTKMNTIFQETIRMILNVSDHLLWGETVKNLKVWSNCLFALKETR